MDAESSTEIESSEDIVVARRRGRTLAVDLGFGGGDVTLIAAAISEVARNIVDHAGRGRIILRPITGAAEPGIQIVATDNGPGIRDVARAMQYGHSMHKGLGVGLPGTKWLMDEFDIVSQAGKGTTVTMRKWRR